MSQVCDTRLLFAWPDRNARRRKRLEVRTLPGYVELRMVSAQGKSLVGLAWSSPEKVERAIAAIEHSLFRNPWVDADRLSARFGSSVFLVLAPSAPRSHWKLVIEPGGGPGADSHLLERADAETLIEVLRAAIGQAFSRASASRRSAAGDLLGLPAS